MSDAPEVGGTILARSSCLVVSSASISVRRGLLRYVRVFTSFLAVEPTRCGGLRRVVGVIASYGYTIAQGCGGVQGVGPFIEWCL